MSKILFVDSRYPGQTVSSPPNKKYSLTFYVNEGAKQYEDGEFYYLRSRVRFYVGREAKHTDAYVKFNKESGQYAGAEIRKTGDVESSSVFSDIGSGNAYIGFNFSEKLRDLSYFGPEDPEASKETRSVDHESSLRPGQESSQDTKKKVETDIPKKQEPTDVASGTKNIDDDASNITYEFVKIIPNEDHVYELIKSADSFSVVNDVPDGGDHLKIKSNVTFYIYIDDSRFRANYNIDSEINIAVYIKKQDRKYSKDSDFFVYASLDDENKTYYIQGYNKSDIYEFQNPDSGIE